MEIWKKMWVGVFSEHSVCSSYLQPRFTKVSNECVIDSRRRTQKTTSRGLVQFLVTVTHKKNQNVRKGTYGRTFVKLVMHLKQTWRNGDRQNVNADHAAVIVVRSCVVTFVVDRPHETMIWHSDVKLKSLYYVEPEAEAVLRGGQGPPVRAVPPPVVP